jgi:CheY-like chemotaxis protein
METQMSETPKVTSVEPPQGLRILVVEDDDDLREIVSGSLMESGYDVIQASSGMEALHRLEKAFGPQATERAVDLVLSDVRMAEMDGLRLTEHIRSARWPLPVVLMSAFPSPDVRAEARRLRAALLPKPFRIESLRLIITITLPAARSKQ